jgi:transposase
MLRIEHVQDVETLRQMALLLDRENQRLVERIKALQLELSQLRGEEAAGVQRQLAFLQDVLARRERILQGHVSEKRPRKDAGAEEVNGEPQRGHGPRSQPKLPVVEQVHELAEADRVCKACGGALTEMVGQTEDAEEVTVVERHFVLVKQQRKKYRCSCNGCIETAPAPPKVIPGSRYSPEFAVEVAVSKYLDHLPLERQVRIMGREGLIIDSQTLWDQIEGLARILQPTYDALRSRVLEAGVVFADETHWKLMGKAQTARWWVWAAACSDAVVYRILDSRATEAAAKVLPDYRGIVMADGYGAYEALARAGPAGPGFRLVHCWAHVRRKFVEIEASFPSACAEILDRIGQLYGIEQEARGDSVDALERRADLRTERSAPIVQGILDWALAQRPLPRSELGQAIRYMLGMWNGLTAFLHDPRIPLDNNTAERGLRGLVLGRKNHYGSRSRRGTEVAALLYSLLESAKLAGAEPKSYLLAATHAAIANPAAPLLPHTLLS